MPHATERARNSARKEVNIRELTLGGRKEMGRRKIID